MSATDEIERHQRIEKIKENCRIWLNDVLERDLIVEDDYLKLQEDLIKIFLNVKKQSCQRLFDIILQNELVKDNYQELSKKLKTLYNESNIEL